MDSIEAKAGVQGGNKMAEDLPDVPPYWRAPLSNKADLGELSEAVASATTPDCITLTGYPDFVPARPGFSQPEDRITEQNVKQGFQGINAVSVQVSELSPFSRYLPIFLCSEDRRLLGPRTDQSEAQVDGWKCYGEPEQARG